MCGGGSIAASFENAASFSHTGMVLRFFGVNYGQQINASASSWDSASQQATFTVPQTLLAAAGTQQVQVLLDTQSFESTNFTFEYTAQAARIVSTSPKQAKNSRAIKLIPSLVTQVTINLKGLDIRSADDLSLVMSGGGSTLTLTQSYFTSTCTSSACSLTFKFTPPQDTSPGTKTLLISSKACSSSQAEVQLDVQGSTAEVVPSRASTLGGETMSLYVVNAPTSTSLPFDAANVRVECGSTQATIIYVSPHSAESTTVRFTSAEGTVESGTNEKVTSCQVYRHGDSAKLGATFDITYFLGLNAHIRDLEVVESSAVGNQFGGANVRLSIVDMPASYVDSVTPNIQFGETPATLEILERRENSVALQITSPSITRTEFDISSTKVVKIANPDDASKFVAFTFSYSWVQAPVILAVQPDKASTAGGEQLTLQIADVSPDSIASDITIVFQQDSTTQLPCSTFKYEATEQKGVCTVIVPVGLTATAGDSADPTGLSVFTAQQGRSKAVDFAFTYFDDSLPQPVDSWVLTKTYVSMVLDNYCTDHTANGASDYGLSLITSDDETREMTYIFGSYGEANGECQTRLTVSTNEPELTASYTVTVTLGATGKSVDFLFPAVVSSLKVTSSLDQSIVSSAPELTLTLDNMKDGNGALCHINSCASLTPDVRFGSYSRGTLLTLPQGCVQGLCRIKVQAPTLVTSGDMVVTVSNTATGDASSDQVATFNFAIFEYNCDVFCNQLQKITSVALIEGSQGPTNPTCLERFCMERRIRSPGILSISNRAQSGAATCRYNENCEVYIGLSEITAAILTASTVSTQLSVMFGGTQATSIMLDSQDGDDVVLRVTTPIVSSPSTAADLMVYGTDESGMLLTATAKG